MQDNVKYNKNKDNKNILSASLFYLHNFYFFSIPLMTLTPL
jgi:hypothetical protein